MKVILGHTLPPGVAGTIEIDQNGKIVTAPERSHVLGMAFMNAARQFAEQDGITQEQLDSAGGPEVLAWMMGKMGGRLFWCEPADDEAAKVCGRPVYQPDQPGSVTEYDDGNTAVFAQSAHVGSSPESSDVALSGKDGAALARLLSKAQTSGAARFAEVTRAAVASYTGYGELFSRLQLHEISQILAAVNSTAELLGRFRVREMADRAEQSKGLHKFADDVPMSSVGINPLTAIRTPEDALRYFLGLNPKLGVDPERFAGEQRRRAFTLAHSTSEVLTRRVQEAIGKAMGEHKGTADVTEDVARLLDDAGVSTGNPQYSEMVFRTNAMDAYQTGAYEEGRNPDISDVFPAWEYLGVNDERAGADHRPHFGKLFRPAKAFADVRGPRVFNCRCSMRWVDRYELGEREARGEKVTS